MGRPAASWQLESLGASAAVARCRARGYGRRERRRTAQVRRRERPKGGKNARQTTAVRRVRGGGCRLGDGRRGAGRRSRSASCPGVVDPFYQVMELGVNKAAEDLGIEVVTQIPPTWGVEAQTPILDALVARGDLDYIITAPVDKDQMVGPLQAAVDAGIKVITVDTFLGDGDYVGRPGHLPAQLHRLGQRRGRPHLGARARRGDRRQGQGLHQLDQPERQLGRGPRAGLRRGDDERVSRHHRDRAGLQPRRPEQGGAADRRGARARARTSPGSSAPTCSAPRAPARR